MKSPFTPICTVSLRAKVLFTNKLQKRVAVQEKVKVKKKPKFEDVSMSRMVYFMAGTLGDEYETKIKTYQANLGTDQSTLEALFDSRQF